MRYLVVLLFSFTLLFGITGAEKHLSSKDRASSHLENLIFDGEFDKAEEFAKLANEKYEGSADLLCWTGKVYFEKKDLDTAKFYFLQALDINPTHDMAKMQQELIQEQEDALENKDVESLLGFIQDKGLDFLMIFLAFLGGEIIAKRYNMCQNSSIYIMANHFIQRKSLTNSGYSRIALILNQYKNQNIGSFCFIINLLVIITITIAIMIFWLFTVFHYELNSLVYGNILTINAEGIEFYLGIVFIGSLIVTIFGRALMRYSSLPKDEILYKIEFVEEIDALLERGAYTDIYKVLEYMQSHGIDKDDMKTLLEQYSQNTEAIMKFNETDKSFNF